MSGEKFGRHLVWHIVACAAVILGLPFAIFIAAAILANDFSFPHKDDIVETVRLTTGTGLAVFVYVIAVTSFSYANWRRMKTLGFPGFASFIVFMLFLLDAPFFVPREETEMFGSSLSSSGGYPLYLLSALSMTVAMTFVQAPCNNVGAFRRFGYAGYGLAVAIGFILIGNVLFVAAAKGIDLIEYRVKHEQDFDQTLLWFIRNMYWVLKLLPFACFALMVSSVGCVILSRRDSLDPNLR